MIHKIKLDTKWFDDVLCGNKTVEIRKNDRNYQEFDDVWMTEYFPNVAEQPENPRVIVASIGTCIKGFNGAIMPDWIVFSLIQPELLESEGQNE